MGDVIEILTTATNTVEVEAQGPQGIPGVGVPTGGSTGQVLRKASSADYATEWAAAGSGSGSVTSVALASTDLTITGSPITDSGTITANIAANAVTLEKLQTISSEHLLGRHGSGNGGVQQVGLGTGLAISGSNVRVATTGITAGTYTKLTVDETGRATVGATATPSDIGAQSAQDTETLSLSASVTLTGSRNKLWKISNNTASNYFVELPTTGIAVGDIVEIEYTSSTGRELAIRRDGVAFGMSLPNGARGTYRADTATATGWTAVGTNYNTASSIYVSQGDVLLGRQDSAGQVQFISCTAAGRELLDDADAAAQRTTLGLGTAATAATGDFAAASHTHTPSEVGLGNVSNTAQVTSVTGTAPIVSSGGTTPTISIQNSPTFTGDVIINGASTGVTGSLKVGNTTGSFNRDVEIGGNGIVLRNIGGSGTTTIALGQGSTSSYTLTPPAASGTIALTGHTHAASDVTSGTFDNARINFAAPAAIGNTTPNTGAFTSLSTAPAANTSALTTTGYSLTGSNAQSLVDLAGTWNTTGTPSAIKLNITDTASNASSLLMQLQTGGTNRFTVNKSGVATGGGFAVGTGDFISNGFPVLRSGTTEMLCFTTNSSVNVAANGLYSIGWASGGPTATSIDVRMWRDAAAAWALRDSTTAQEARVYGTFTSSTNYQRMTIKSVKQTLSALSGASATTTGTFIPDGAVVVGVTTRVATALTGAAGYTIGDGTDADRWGDITGTAIGTTSDNRDWTAGTIECFTAGGEITLTAKTSNFTAGAIEICVFYLAGQAD